MESHLLDWASLRTGAAATLAASGFQHHLLMAGGRAHHGSAS